MDEPIHPLQLEGFKRMAPAEKLRMVADLYQAGSGSAWPACAWLIRTGPTSGWRSRRGARCSMPAPSPFAPFIEPLERLEAEWRRCQP